MYLPDDNGSNKEESINNGNTTYVHYLEHRSPAGKK